MGWYELSLLISDSRIKFLLAFIVFAIVVAGGLVIYELRMKKKEEKVEDKVADESYISRVRRVVRSDKGPRQKLEQIDIIVKKYFKENFGTNLNSSYSTLIDEFERMGRADFLDFCDLIFNTFYSRGSISEEKVEEVAKSFINSIRRKENEDDLESYPSMGSRLKSLLLSPVNYVRDKVDYFKRLVRRNNRLRRQRELKKRSEIKQNKFEEERLVLRKVNKSKPKLDMTKREVNFKSKDSDKDILDSENKSNNDVSELKSKSIAKRVPYNFEKSNFLKNWKKDPDFVGTRVALKEENKQDKMIVPDLKILKDSIDGDFEMNPPVGKRSSQDVLGRTVNSN